MTSWQMLASIATAAAFIAMPGLAVPPSATPSWPLRISADKHHLVDAAGRPFLVVGDSAWSLLVQLSAEETLRYLDDRRARGFNAILVNLVEHRFSAQSPPWRNAAGSVPFMDTDDFTAPNPDYFDHVDTVLQAAMARGIAVMLAPAYLGIGCGDEGWCGAMRRNGATKLRAYGEQLGRRYGAYPNVLWVHGGDQTPSDSDLALVEAVRAGIVEASGDTQLHLYHWSRNIRPSADRRLRRLDVDTLYSYNRGTLAADSIAAFKANNGVRPFIFIEGLYENEHYSLPQDWREQIYTSVLGGGAGFIFGNFPIWSFQAAGDPGHRAGDGRYPGGWTQALDGAGSRAVMIAARFFEELDWPALRPDLAHEIMTSGFGEIGRYGYVLMAATADRRLAVAHFPAIRASTINMSRFPGPVRAAWFDPATGASTPVGDDAFANSGMRAFTPPGLRAETSGDWLLVLQVPAADGIPAGAP